MRRLRFCAVLVLTVSAASLFCTGAGSALALFGATKSAGSNTFTAGTWAYYLHNNPTPPTANTAAQYNLTMTSTAPTATTLFRYDTDNANGPVAASRNNPPSPGLLTAYRYVNWRTPALASTLALGTTVTVDIWSETNTAAGGRNGSLIVYLRDYNPTAGTYVEIANCHAHGRVRRGSTWYETPIQVTVPSGTTLSAGHMLEVKIEAPQATAQNNMVVAYDTTTYPCGGTAPLDNPPRRGGPAAR